MGKRIISFSLWGSKGTHLDYAVMNVKEALTIYPDWICRFYVAPDVPLVVQKELYYNGAEIVQEIPKHGSWEGLFWRFYPVINTLIEYVIIRDADSIVNWRERAAVDEWIESKKYVHIMRDHDQHTVPILGGMWGSIGGLIPNLKDLIEAWIKRLGRDVQKGDDQEFLKDVIWPSLKDFHIAHDSCYIGNSGLDWGNSKPFPPHKKNHIYAPYVGAIIDDVKEILARNG